MTHELRVAVAAVRGGRRWLDPRCTCGWHGRQTTIVQRATEEHDKHVEFEEARHADR